MGIDAEAARTFIYANGRLVEQLVYAAWFDGGDPDRVLAAVAAYQNDDGGFGHGLEPDKRGPPSQPLDVEVALERLVWVGAKAPDVVTRACEFLLTVADASGAVPVLLPSIAGYPRAAHWADTEHYPPGLNPTAAIVAHVHALGATHPWADKATDYCFSALEHEGPPSDAHALLCVARFLEQAPDVGRAAALGDAVAAALPESSYFQARPDPDAYGLSPLEFAPTPSAWARSWFDDTILEAHLEHLEREQQRDGGWPIRWQPPSEASRCEWRAIRTLQTLRVLAAYGRPSV